MVWENKLGVEQIQRKSLERTWAEGGGGRVHSGEGEVKMKRNLS